MKVLQVIDTLQVGGAEKMTVLLSNLLYESDIDVELLVLVGDEVLLNELNPNITVHRLNRTRRFNLYKAKKVANLVSNFDIIHIHLKHNYRYISFCSKLFGGTKAKLIMHDHSHTLRIKSGTVRAIKDWFFKNIFKPENYIGVHQDHITWAIEILKLKKERCFLLENVIKKKEVKGLKSSPSGVVMVGNINSIKNIEFAFKLIKYSKQNLTVYGRNSDKEYLKELKVEAEDLNISNKVTFIHNCMDVQSHLHKYKYALHTSKKETGPLVLLEYLAHGLPFVSYASGQVYETLKNEIPSFFCNSFNESDWLQKIDNLHLMDKKQIQDCYTNKFSTANYLKKCLKAYSEILPS